ncbi:Phosphonate degradation operons associated HDIG domain protein [Paraburkholderia unamae]|uniref:phosphonate degradation HD-domain oxygenase n=1 Tax=Paraburkholderia unamae TaxID=219649 RepID=UPI001CAC24F6|nr:phosphonate degradation HD-domain oxygenase [Paraburkholderia unamae]CAG9246113.1 Phosphonate degradation operons associated HDIG domain protein [Paraburkholderia unamae]
MSLQIEDIRSLFESYGEMPYSREPVTQLQHALQTASLAESEGAPDTLVAAAFLHDLGHMLRLHQKASDAPKPGEDDLHQFFALPFLRSRFPDAVLEPIKLHVEAKRYLCAIDPAYHAGLSPVSVHSLELQGGIHSRDEVERFRSLPFSDDALRLRRWDDRAKTPGVETPNLAHYLAIVESVQQRRSEAELR